MKDGVSGLGPGMRLWGLCLYLLLAVMPAAAQMQNSVNVAYLQGKAPVAPDAISVLVPDLFGDQINLYNGSFSIEQTDAELPGNSALRVAVVRMHESGRQWMTRSALGERDLNTQRIQGSVAVPEGWVPQRGSAANRCSAFIAPPCVARGGFSSQDFTPDEYWQGMLLVVPGQGSQEILSQSVLPGAGQGWTLATRNLWKLGCLASLQNAPGQGFVALSPDAVAYRFDWMASRVIPGLRKGNAALDLRDMFLMSTRVSSSGNGSVWRRARLQM